MSNPDKPVSSFLPSMNLMPVDAIIPKLMEELRVKDEAVVIAAPGAGKTTRIPLAIMKCGWAKNARILVLQPRRLAARSAAIHVADLLGEKVGQCVGYRVRHDSRCGDDTRIEYITDGVFVRMILDDPELTGICAVLFDEFHERNLDSDLGMALAIDTKKGFRPDLKLVAMSATLDGGQVASLFEDAPVIESEGRAFPVTIEYEQRRVDERVEGAMERSIRRVLAERDGSILCFLPGQKEIKYLAHCLGEKNILPKNTTLHMLYGAMEIGVQNAAIAPAIEGERKIVLATSIAETSITIDGVDTIIDSGLARIARFDVSAGVSRLETVRASKASIKQRAGRAGRTAPGKAIRLWHEGQTASLPEFEVPQILESDLSSLILNLADWGVRDITSLSWLNVPPMAKVQSAESRLKQLGALDEYGVITVLGRAISKLSVAPPLAKMVLSASRSRAENDACVLAALISEAGLGGKNPDLEIRMEGIKNDRSKRSLRGVSFAKSLARQAGSLALGLGRDQTAVKAMPVIDDISVGGLLSIAYPDRIAANMGGEGNGMVKFRLANGRQCLMEETSAIARQPFIVASDIQGSASRARILSAASITLEEIKSIHSHLMVEERRIILDRESGKFHALNLAKLGQLDLIKQHVPLNEDDELETALIEAIRQDGMISKIAAFKERAILNLIERLRFAHRQLPESFPKVDEETLASTANEWLAPFISGARGFGEIDAGAIRDGLYYYIGQEGMSNLEKIAPKSFKLPGGREQKLTYDDNGRVMLSARAQEFYSLKNHPVLDHHFFSHPVAITVELLSPAMRPIQATKDLPGFWAGSWQEVRKEMRGRYPKHLWPEDPANTPPTTKTKKRLQG